MESTDLLDSCVRRFSSTRPVVLNTLSLLALLAGILSIPMATRESIVQTKVNKLKNIIITLLDPRIIRIRRPLGEMDPRISADPTNSCGTGSAGGPIRDPHISDV
jgi:hypothetical protein